VDVQKKKRNGKGISECRIDMENTKEVVFAGSVTLLILVNNFGSVETVKLR
jgi:hypothetical protein